MCKNMLHPGYAAPASETSHVPAELARNCCFFFCVLRGTPRTLTGRPTAGAHVLARVPKVPWHPYHSGAALHCRVPCSPFVLAFLQKHRVQAFRSFCLDCICFRLELLSCLVFWWDVTEQEITLNLWEHSVPDVDASCGWEHRRFFDHFCGTADLARPGTRRTLLK